jgi:MFS transporter, DHA1 family, multidrug resistance protein
VKGETATVSAAPGRLATTTLVLLGSFAALGPLSLDIYLPAVTPMSQDLVATAREATASLSIFFIGMSVGQLFVGPWSDRVGRRLPLLTGLVMCVIGAVICALAPNVAALLTGRMMQAFGGSAVMVTGRAAIRDHLDERSAASFFSTTASINSLAPMLAPSVGAAILLVTGWRGIFGVVAAFALLLLVGTAFRLPESHRPVATAAPTHPFRVYLNLLKHAQFVRYLVAAAANGASYFTYMALSPLVLMSFYNLTASAYAALMAVNGVALIFCTQINRWLLRRTTPRRILRVAGVIALCLAIPVFAFGFTLFGGLVALVGIMFMVTMGGGFVQANALAVALSAEPRHVGSAAALFGAALFGFGTVASMVGGMIYDGTPRPLMYIIGVMQLVMAFALYSASKGAQAEEPVGNP